MDILISCLEKYLRIGKGVESLVNSFLTSTLHADACVKP